MHHLKHIWTIVMLKICKNTFYTYLSRIWKMMQFTRFIRKVFATKILLSGKFSLFVTLREGPTVHSAINVYETLCNHQTISIAYIFREGPTLLWASPVRKTHMQRLFPKIHLESGIRKLLRPDIWLGSYYWLILVTFFRIKAATALYMVAVVEVSESQIIGIWITLDHSG